MHVFTRIVDMPTHVLHSTRAGHVQQACTSARAPAEVTPHPPLLQVSYAESEFAAYTGHKYCVGLNSCGSAIYLGLWAVGVKEGDTVLSNALTFNAVPSAIHHAGAKGTPKAS